jgi:hypothetical protein
MNLDKAATLNPGSNTVRALQNLLNKKKAGLTPPNADAAAAPSIVAQLASDVRRGAR